MHILMRCLLQSGVSFSSSVSPTWRQGVLTCTAQAFKSPKFHSMSWVLVPTPQARSVAVQTYAPVPRTEKQYLGSPALWNISYDIMMSPLPTTFDLKMKSQIQEIPWTSLKKCWIPWLSLPWHWYPLTSLEKELHRLHANQAKLHHPGTEVPVLSTCSQHKSRDLPNALVTAVFLHPSSLVPRSSLENRSQASLSDWSDRNASWAAKTDQKGSGSSLSQIESLLREVHPGFAVLKIAKHHHFWKKLDHEPWFFLFRTESRKSVCAPYSTWVQALLLHSEKWIW